MPGVAVSSMCEMLGQIKFEWKIQNFFQLSHDHGDYLESPSFRLDDAEWRLRVYPKGNRHSAIGWISVCLERLDVTVDHTVSYYFAVKAGESIVETVKSESIFTAGCNTLDILKCVQRSVITDSLQDASWDGALSILISAQLVNGRIKEVASQTSRITGVENLSKIFELLLGGRQTDVRLKVQRREFNAHKLVLRVRSPVFDAMFDHEMVEKNSGVVEISDLNPDTFQDFLSFVYTGKLDILSPSNALDLYKAADKYDLKDMKSECSFLMASWLSLGNILDVVLLAATRNDTELLHDATEYFRKNAKDIFSMEKWVTFYLENTTIANDLLMKVLRRN